MSYEAVVAEAARAAARRLIPQYGPRVAAEVEAALYSPGEPGPPQQYFDPLAIGGLILAAAQFAYQVYSDRRKKGEKPAQDSVARAVRLEWRKETDLTAGAEKVIEIVSAEIVQRGEHGIGQ